MIKNYFRVAWRHLVRHGFYSILNIFGLAVGIGFTFLIGGYVWSELQVNKTLKDPDRQCILQSKWTDPNMGIELTTVGPLAKTLKEQYPGKVANYYRFDGITSTVSKGEKYFREGVQVGDTTFFSMFDFPVLYGNVRTAFDDPFSVVITAEKAVKYFGRTDVVGEVLSIDNFSGSKHGFTVTAVLKPLPDNSVTKLTLGIDNGIFVPATCLLTFFGRDMEKWDNQYIVSYIKLQEGVQPKDLAGPMAQLVQEHAPENIRTNLRVSATPLPTYYLESANGLIKKLLYTLSFVALFMLLMAVINFINISVSKSSVRIREIGVRKVLGSLKPQLIFQFVMESVILVFMATVLALILYQAGRPFLSELLGKRIPMFWQFPPVFMVGVILFILILGFASGLYPAFVLSSLNLVGLLKGTIRIKENIVLRKSLMGIQFATAIIVLISTIVVSKQINFFFSKDLGYDKEYIVSAQLPREWSEQGVQRMEAIRDQFLRMPEIGNVSLSYEIPNGGNRSSFAVYKSGSNISQALSMQSLMTDERYAETYHIPLEAGVFFRHPNEMYDSTRVVLNETAAKALGWKDPQDAIGKQVRIGKYDNLFTIYGVTKDFHFGSMQDMIPPFIFMHVKYLKEYRYFSFKLRPGNISSTIETLQRKWQALLPGSAFEYAFMDETLQKMYQTEIQLKKAATAATVLTLLIVLLGVFGLVSLSVYKKMKEVGIRKVLGASVASIVLLFLKEFLVVISIAFLIALPLGYYIMNEWLHNYAYRIGMSPQPFVLSLFIITLMTAALVSFQTLKMALTTSVKTLRSE